MPSIVVETNDVKKALDLLILEKARGAKKLASGIKKLTNSREKLNGHIRIPIDMFRNIQKTIPAAGFNTSME
jgi:hypothetical protein